MRAEYNRSLSQLLKQDRNRFEREYNEAEKNSLPARQLLFEGNESSQTIQDREWQEFYFFSLLLKGRSAQEILTFLEPFGFLVFELRSRWPLAAAAGSATRKSDHFVRVAEIADPNGSPKAKKSLLFVHLFEGC